MASETTTPALNERFVVTYPSDNETFTVEVVATYPTDGAFDVRPLTGHQHEWTIYPGELTAGVAVLTTVEG